MLGNCSHRLLLFLAFFSVLSPLAQRTLLETLSRVLERKAALQYFHAPTEKQMGFREIYGKQKRLPSAITLSRTPASSIGENKSSSRPILSFKTFRLFLYISKERTPHSFFSFLSTGLGSFHCLGRDAKKHEKCGEVEKTRKDSGWPKRRNVPVSCCFGFCPRLIFRGKPLSRIPKKPSWTIGWNSAIFLFLS